MQSKIPNFNLNLTLAAHVSHVLAQLVFKMHVNGAVSVMQTFKYISRCKKFWQHYSSSICVLNVKDKNFVLHQ